MVVLVMASDHIVNAADDNCFVHISSSLNAIVMQGALPDSFLHVPMHKLIHL